MGKRGPLGDYVDSLRQSGYEDSAIRTYLASRGYSEDQIRQAVGGGGHHGVLLALLVSVLALIIIGTASFLLLTPKAELTLQISAGQVEVKQGGSLTFDLLATPAAANPEFSGTITGPQTLALDIAGSRGTVAIPSDAATGRYTVTIRANAQGDSAGGTFSFFVVEDRNQQAQAQNEPTQKNPEAQPGQNPGAPQQSNRTPHQETQEPSTAEVQCPLGCNDFNACTTDICDVGVCRYEDKPKPCCGDNICADGETSVTCPADCEARAELPSTPELIQLAINTYRSDNTKALNLCGALQKTKDKDVCFSQVARTHNVVEVCSGIGDDASRDSCLMHFVLKLNNYDVCKSLTSALMQNSCFSLQRLKQAETEARQVQNGT